MRPSRTPRSALSAVLSTALVGAALTAPAVLLAPSASAAAFTPGNLVVVRVGDGSGLASGVAAATFLDEYTPAGALVGSVPLPVGDSALTLLGTATTEGGLARSADGRSLVLAGYRSAPGTTPTTATTKTVAVVDAAGSVDATTAVPYAGAPRGAVSTDGSALWLSGAVGIVATTKGSTTTSDVAAGNFRQPALGGDRLWVTGAASSLQGLGAVGTGLPTTSSTVTPVTTVGATSAAVLDLSPAVPGADTAYVGADSGTGITKWSTADGTTWVNRGTVAPTTVRAVTAVPTATGVALAATTTAGALVTLTDSAAFDAAPAASTPTTLATAAAGTALRGVAFAPEGGGSVETAPSITTQPASTTVRENGTATLTVAATGTAPLAYQWYQGAAGDISTPVGDGSASFTTPALTGTTSYWVRVTNGLGSADSTTATVTVDLLPACSAADTPIGAVQGSGETSPLAGTAVTVQGTVVGDYEGPSPALRGFYLQDAGDGDPATSDAVFVFNNLGGSSPDLVTLGDVVQVTGPAGENQGQTQITATSIEGCGTTGTVTPTDVTLPLATPTGLEPFEGMLVRLPQTLTVTEHFQLGRFGQVTVSSGGRLRQPTALFDAGSAEAAALTTQNALSSLIVDDGLNNQNADPIVFGRGGQPLSATNTLRGGDTLTGAVGVMTYTWAGNAASGNAYRLRPVGALGGTATFTAVNERPTGTPEVGGTVRVASANLLNFFNTFTGCTFGVGGAAADCRGANNQAEYDRQLAKEVAALTSLQADVIGVMELENDGYGAGSAIAALVAALNAEDGAGTWDFVNPDAATGTTNSAGTDAIKVALLYRTASVTAVPGRTFALQDSTFERHPVAQTFARPDGSLVTVAVNHFKSKGSCPAAGDPDADAGDGQGCWNVRRTAQATALAAWLDGTVVPAAGSPDVLVVGDLNSYAAEDPIQALEAAGYVDLVERFGGDEAYSYVFDGRWGYLDHALASPSLAARTTGAADVHINADEPSVLDYNTEFKTPGQVASLYAPDRFRTSDHDPVVVGLDLRTAASTTTVTSSAPSVLHRGSVRWTATVSTGGAPASGGTVRFRLGATDLGAPVPVVGGVATSPATTALPPGATTVTAVYSGTTGVAGSEASLVQEVRFGIVRVTPAPKSSYPRGSVVPIRFRLFDAVGNVPDAVSAQFLGECRVSVAVTGAQPLPQTCELAYDRATDEWSYRWATAKKGAKGAEVLTVSVSYPGLVTPTTLGTTFRLT